MNDSPVRIAPSVLRFSRRHMVLSLALVFVTVFLIVQLWLLTQAIEATLQGEIATMLPAVVGSGLCFVGTWRLWRAGQRNA